MDPEVGHAFQELARSRLRAMFSEQGAGQDGSSDLATEQGYSPQGGLKVLEQAEKWQRGNTVFYSF